jgi:hypothetical protein
MPPSHLSTGLVCELSRLDNYFRNNDLMAWAAIERLSGTRKQLKANMQYDKKSLGEKERKIRTLVARYWNEA